MSGVERLLPSKLPAGLYFCSCWDTQGILQESKLPSLRRADDIGLCLPASRQPDSPAAGRPELTDTGADLLGGRLQLQVEPGAAFSRRLFSPPSLLSCLAGRVVSECFHDRKHPARCQLLA